MGKPIRSRQGLLAAAVLLAVVSVPAVLNAQIVAPLVTDRPDFTESALTVPRGDVQLESGYTLTRADDADEHALGEILLRIGVAGRLEARIGLGSHAWSEAPGEDPSGFEDPALGLKLVLSEETETGGLAAAVLAGTSVPVGDEDVGEDEWQPEITLALSRGIADGLSIGGNLGYAYASEGGDRFDQGSASLALGMELSERWGSYVEAFTIFPSDASGEDAAVVNGGFTFLVHPLLQLDARAGAGLTEAAPDFFLGVGIARRW
ncbi:MAG: transporter [Gemmatimonadota bacterium]